MVGTRIRIRVRTRIRASAYFRARTRVRIRTMIGTRSRACTALIPRRKRSLIINNFKSV